MQVNMHDAKSRLGELVAGAERGEDVVITRDGTPAVRLVAVVIDHPPARRGDWPSLVSERIFAAASRSGEVRRRAR
jgi:prevent-host-death family protein